VSYHDPGDMKIQLRVSLHDVPVISSNSYSNFTTYMYTSKLF
jgi:hypothetical protein